MPNDTQRSTEATSDLLSTTGWMAHFLTVVATYLVFRWGSSS